MELFKLFGTIGVNNEDANQKIDETTDKAEKSSSKFGSAFEKIGGAAVKIGSVAAAGIGAVATGLGALTKQAMSSYADYEQLVGGVETLFKDSASKVLAYSQEAYKTAGLSANAYMEQVTSFSASMIASLGGDTEKAAEKSNQAIIDMSDNANKMGSSMESIQNAYNGFAKQNYTMLDNLKLGYGGTKEEMQRLLEDANKINAEQGIMTEYSIENFGDIVDAIHTVQDNLGITGTTSKEAASTISGSIGMMKGAWTNFISAMAQDDADFGQVMQDLIDSALAVADNIAPRLIETIPRLVEGLNQLLMNLIPYINPLLEQLLPPLLEGAAQLIVTLISNLPQLISTLGSALLGALETMFSAIGGMLPESVLSNFSLISEGFQLIWEMCKTFWETIGQPVFDLIVDCVGIVKDWFNENFGDIETIVADAFSGIEAFWNEHLKPCFEAIGNFISEVLAPTFEFVFKNFILPVISDTIGRIKDFWNNSLKPIFTGIIDFLTGVFSGDWEKAFKGIINVAKGLLNGIKAIFEAPFETAKSIVKNAIESIKKLFNFKWELPKLKLPHFGVSPSGWQIGDLLKGSIPKLGIEWYAKGGVMDGVTPFGVNGNNLMIGGEAGKEAIIPLEKNTTGIELIAQKLSENMPQNDTDVIQAKMNIIIELLERILGMRITLDSGALVGQLAPAMDVALGTIYETKERGGRSTW